MPREKTKLTKEFLEAQRKITGQAMEKDETPLVTMETPQIELKDSAFGVAKDPNTGTWHAIRIDFDFAANVVGPVQKVGEGDIRAIARERMLIEQANMIFQEF